MPGSMGNQTEGTNPKRVQMEREDSVRQESVMAGAEVTMMTTICLLLSL